MKHHVVVARVAPHSIVIRVDGSSFPTATASDEVLHNLAPLEIGIETACGGMTMTPGLSNVCLTIGCEPR